jgi:hypothetical protein
MVFNTVLFFAVLAITVIFLYLSYTFKRDADKKKTYTGEYHIELTADFAGESLSIYVNDSLLLNGTMPDTSVVFNINRLAEENALIIVDNATDIMTPFNLSKEGSKVMVKKQKGEIVLEETPTRF